MASPAPTASKRSLEETSPGQDAVPDAKRPALDQSPSPESKVKSEPQQTESNGSRIQVEPVKTEEVDGKTEATATAPAAGASTAAATTENDGQADAAAAAAAEDTQNQATVDETSWIHIRAIVSNPEAATIIGRGGENINLIRKSAETKLTISDYQRGAIERVLTISGPLDNVAKVRFWSKAPLRFRLLTCIGVWLDCPYFEPGASRSVLHYTVEGLSFAHVGSSYFDWCCYWSWWFQNPGNSGTVWSQD